MTTTNAAIQTEEQPTATAVGQTEEQEIANRKEWLESWESLLFDREMHRYPQDMTFEQWLESLGLDDPEMNQLLLEDAETIRDLGLPIQHVAELDPEIASEILTWDRELFAEDIRHIVALGADATKADVEEARDEQLVFLAQAEYEEFGAGVIQ